MSLKNMWSKISRSTTDYDAHLSIPAARVLDAASADAPAALIPHRCYFEVRLKQMFLQNRREYAREFVALSSFNTEFMFAGARIEAPLVVGPSMLAKAEQVARGDQVEFLNTRVVGPCPYEGDDVELFAGLFRMTTNNWARRAISLLEVLAKSFDTSKLSASLTLAKPLSAGIESMLGMDEVELRLGKHLSFAAADSGGPAQGSLRPAYIALLRRSRTELGADEARRFWVKDGRLFYGDDADTLVEFRECDFMLVHIAALARRSDYTSFDFHQRHWRKIEDLLVEQKVDEALASFRLLAARLVECDDIVRAHRFELLKRYREWIDSSVAEYEQLFGVPKSTPTRGGGRPRSSRVGRDAPRSGPGRRSSRARPERVGELELGAGLEDSTTGAGLTPEQMLASLG